MTLGLYFHIPFCLSRCRYCDFVTYSGREHLIPSYTRALAREVGGWKGHRADTIYFGGGTPSLLPLEGLKLVLEAIGEGFDLQGAEVSLEANPGDLSLAYLRGLRALGVNRLSIGAQSFQEEELRLLGRRHHPEETREGFLRPRSAGFRNINLDLLFGLPGQPLGAFQESLNAALALGPDHLSLYALTLEEGTPLALEIERGLLPVLDPDRAAEMYSWAEDFLAGEGWEHYEISNWALLGKRCQHNLRYWKNQPYLGFGAGAHSFYGGRRWANTHSVEEYIQRLEEGKAPVEEEEEIGLDLERGETMMLGLRLVEGVDLEKFSRRFGGGPRSFYPGEVQELEGLGLLEEIDGHLRLTRRGRLLGNEAFLRFVPT